MNVDRKKIYLAQPRGFCAGVCRALATVDRVMEVFGPPLFVKHEIVHNDSVVAGLREQGVIFIEDLSEVPAGRPLVFSAHGVPADFEKAALATGSQVVDATCPLVKKIHLEVKKYHGSGCWMVLIGHPRHPEVIGTIGQIEEEVFVVESLADLEHLPENMSGDLAVLNQTTLSLEEVQPILTALEKKYAGQVFAKGNDICYATQHRQNAVKAMAPECDLVLVVGSQKSSNSNRLVEVAKNSGTCAFRIDSCADIDAEMLGEAMVIGISAGASAPEKLVQELLTFLVEKGWTQVETIGEPEPKTEFPLPDIPS